MALLSLIASIVSAFLGVYVFYNASKVKLNVVFFIFSLAAAFLCFVEFELRMSESIDRAFFWTKMYTIWPLVIALAMHFIIELKPDLKGKKLIYSLIYIPAGFIFFWLLSVDRQSIYPVKTWWGWVIEYKDNWQFGLMALWLLIMLVLSILVCYLFYRSFTGIRKKQARVIFAGLSFNFVVTIFTDVIFSAFQIKVPELSNSANSISFLILAYAVWKYDLFEISPNSLSGKLIATISETLFLTNANLEILEVNQSAVRLYNSNPNELKGQSLENIFKSTGLESDFRNDILRNMGKNKSVTDLEVNFRTKTNQIIPLSISVATIKLRAQNEPGYIIVGRDITEQKKASEKLKYAYDSLEEIVAQRTEKLKDANNQLLIAKTNIERSESNYRYLTSNIQGMIYRALPNWSVEIISNSELITGYADELFKVGKINWQNLIHPADKERCYKEAMILNHKPASIIQKYRILTKDKKVKHIIDYKTSIFNDEQVFCGIDGIVFDISAQIKLENELIKAKEMAQESDRLKSAFLANMSHEIRTPMNGILGFAGLLKRQGLSGDKQKKYIQIIEQSGKRMLNIINDIIDISKIESGLVKANFKEIDVNEQMNYIHTFFKPEIEAKGMQFVYENMVPKELSMVYTDKEKLIAVLFNLVKNAIKFTKQGSIEFGCRKKPCAKDSAKQFELEFFVKDTGVGIASERLDFIFGRFVRVPSSDDMAIQGAGLGLSISKAYVNMLGGKIWAKSELGKGSVFYFTLPSGSNL